MGDTMQQINIDEGLLKELGLDGFSDDDKNAALQRILQALELRMGLRMAQQVGEDQLEEFQKLSSNGDKDAVADWINKNMPNYQEVAKEELDKIKEDIKNTSRKILEESV
jgi:hypothetical protein